MTKGTRTVKKTVSKKPIEPVYASVVNPEQKLPEEVFIDQEITTKVVNVDTEPKRPTIKIRVIQPYTNWAIGNGIDWKGGTVQEVDFNTWQRVMRDSPGSFVKV